MNADGWRSRDVTEGFRNGDASGSVNSYRAVRPHLQDQNSSVSVPLPPPRRESYHMTPNPPSYSSLVPSSSYTIKSNSSSSYSYSETTRTSSELPTDANANSFISQILERKVSSLKLAGDGSSVVPSSKINTSPVTTNASGTSVAKETNANLGDPSLPGPPSPPQRAPSKSPSTTHTASLSIHIAPTGPEQNPGSRPEPQDSDASMTGPPVPPRPAGIIVHGISPLRGSTAFWSSSGCAVGDSPDFPDVRFRCLSVTSRCSSSSGILEELQICRDSPESTLTPSPTLSHASGALDDVPAHTAPTVVAGTNGQVALNGSLLSQRPFSPPAQRPPPPVFSAGLEQIQQSRRVEGSERVQRETVEIGQRVLRSTTPIARFSEEEKKVSVIKAPHYEGIGPVDETGIPLAVRTTVDRPKDWYKTMFKQIHMVHKPDDDYMYSDAYSTSYINNENFDPVHAHPPPQTHTYRPLSKNTSEPGIAPPPREASPVPPPPPPIPSLLQLRSRDFDREKDQQHDP